MAAVRADLEDAVVTALASLKKPGLPGGTASGYLAKVDFHNGELGPRIKNMVDLQELREALGGQFPCVLVQTGPGKFRPIQLQRRRASQDLDIEILVASGNHRGPKAQTHGSPLGTGVDPGVYKILEDVRKLLQGKDLGVVGAGAMVPQSEEALLMEQSLTIWKQTWSVDADAFAPDPDASAPALTALRAKHHLPESESILVNGVGDSFAVAAGVVTLTDAGGAFTAGMVGARIRIVGATSAANNGIFDITEVPGVTQVRWANAAGVAEGFPGFWKILPPAQVIADTTVDP